MEEVIQQSTQASWPAVWTCIAFWALFGLITGCSLCAVLVRNLLHAVLFLALALIGIAAMYGMLSSTLLMVIQLLVYVGAVVILLIFGIMLTQQFQLPTMAPKSKQLLASAFTCLLLCVTTAYILVHQSWIEMDIPSKVSVEDVGVGFLQKYVLPFEVVSVVLLIAMIGALVLSRKEPESE
jgi:NADH-quinone oxidoreductase subunit J